LKSANFAVFDNNKEDTMNENYEKDLWLIMIGMLLANQDVRDTFFQSVKPGDARPPGVEDSLNAIKSGDRRRVANCCNSLGFDLEDGETCAGALTRRMRGLVQKRRYKAMLAELDGVARFTPELFLGKFKEKLLEVEHVAGNGSKTD